MEIIEYTGPRTEEPPHEPPSWETLEELEHNNLNEQLIHHILEWKGEANFEYFQTQWDLRQDEVRSAVSSLKDVEIKQIEIA